METHQENKPRHTGRYAPIYERGYLASLGNTYFDRTPARGITGIVREMEIYGRFPATRLSVDDFTRRMGDKARRAFEDGWFDALEDGLTWMEYQDLK
jgi:hypothetical protein